MEASEPFLSSDLDGRAGNLLESISFPYGVIARWHDLASLLNRFSPSVVEIHLTAQDMETPPPPLPMVDTELVVHAPEHFKNKLLDLCALDEAHRRWSLAKVSEAVDTARQAAGSFRNTPARIKIVLHPGAMSVGTRVPPGNMSKLKDAAQRSMDALEKLDADFLLENLPPYPWYLGGQWFTNYSMSADDMLEMVSGRRLGITFDTSHAQLYCTWSGRDVVEEFEKMAPYIRHIHVADASGIDGEGLQIGMGDIPWKKLAPRLFGSGLTIMPEIWLGHLHGMAGMLEALHQLQIIWEEAHPK
jgi:N-acetylneuraminate synthase